MPVRCGHQSSDDPLMAFRVLRYVTWPGRKLTAGQPGSGIVRVRHRGLPGLHWMHERDA
jgi:hypothetical protein